MKIRKLQFFAAGALCVAALSASMTPAFVNEAAAQQFEQDVCARSSCDEDGTSYLDVSEEDADAQKSRTMLWMLRSDSS